MGFRLCYRCLGDSHIGQQCPRSKVCGVSGCKEIHSNLLHKDKRNQSSLRRMKRHLRGPWRWTRGQIVHNDKVSQTRPLRTNNSASDREKWKSNDTQQVYTFTAERVTCDMNVIQWSKHSAKYEHLKAFDFPELGSRTIVDLLKGIDYQDLHYSYHDIKGQLGEPVARLTPLGWTCVGNPNQNCENSSNFSSLFIRNGVLTFADMPSIPMKNNKMITLPATLACQKGRHSAIL